MSNQNQFDILVVDDNPANLQVLSNILQGEGYQVRTVTSGKLALRAAERIPPDLILLDITMPDMDGYQVCEALKKDKKLKSIPIIFISALTDTFDKVKAFDIGGVDYITKPIQVEEAMARVRTHLSIQHFQKEIEEKNKALQDAFQQLKETQGQLIQTEKMISLGVLTAGIAHELNNPISFILTSSLGIKNNIDFFINLQKKFDQVLTESKGEKSREYQSFKIKNDYNERLEELNTLVSNIKIGAQRSAEIVKGLRLFTRLDEDAKISVNLHENLDSTLLLLHNSYKDKINIQKSYNKIPNVLCYPAKINQVFLNILKNAIDSFEPLKDNKNQNIITISTDALIEDEKEYISVEIKDNGAGIAEKIKDKIFDPFFTTKDIGKGTGLGLSICKTIINEHNGKLLMESEKNKGTSFKILIPKA